MSSRGASSSYSPSSLFPCHVRLDLHKIVLTQNFEKRGWIETDGDDWNFYWANVTNAKWLFNPESGIRLQEDQVVNHFPNHYELTRKDMMVKNIKRYKKELEKDGSSSSGGSSWSGSANFSVGSTSSVSGTSSGSGLGVSSSGSNVGTGSSSNPSITTSPLLSPLVSYVSSNISSSGSVGIGGGGSLGSVGSSLASGSNTATFSLSSGSSTIGGSGNNSSSSAGASGSNYAGSISFDRTEDGESVYDFVPQTYTLPGDYCIFADEYKRSPNSMWIMKPSSKSRGIGIFIITRLSQIRKWAKDRWAYMTLKDQYVVSRYVDRPLLIGGKKFDLRIYCLVTSFRPLRSYLHQYGFARFCNVKYTNDVSEVDNHFVHLTNVAVQKQFSNYNPNHGCKWNLRCLRLYLAANFGHEETDKLFRRIYFVVLQSLKAVQNIIINDKHCFECYGYDILVDEELKPWLIEVNASPSLTVTTPADRSLKMVVIGDVIDLVCRQKLGIDPWTGKSVDSNDTQLGNFDVLFDECTDPDEVAARQETERQRSKQKYSGRPVFR